MVFEGSKIVARLTYVACWKVVWKQEIQEEVWTQLASNCYTLDLPVDKSSGGDFVIRFFVDVLNASA